MTTIKELKELEAKATKGAWRSHTNYACAGPLKGSFIDAYDASGSSVARIADAHSHGGVGSQEICSANAQLIAATRNALPDLVRVIELAEEVLFEYISQSTDDDGFDILGKTHQVLSEIRKLKGE